MHSHRRDLVLPCHIPRGIHVTFQEVDTCVLLGQCLEDRRNHVAWPTPARDASGNWLVPTVRSEAHQVAWKSMTVNLSLDPELSMPLSCESEVTCVIDMLARAACERTAKVEVDTTPERSARYVRETPGMAREAVDWDKQDHTRPLTV